MVVMLSTNYLYSFIFDKVLVYLLYKQFIYPMTILVDTYV